MRGMREDRFILGPSAHLPDVRRDALLRQLAKSSRQQTRARYPGILLLPPHNPANAGCTVILTTRLWNTRKVWSTANPRYTSSLKVPATKKKDKGDVVGY